MITVQPLANQDPRTQYLSTLISCYIKSALPTLCSPKSANLFCQFGFLLQGQVHQFVPHAALLLPLRELGLQNRRDQGEATEFKEKTRCPARDGLNYILEQ